jgi:hypothetical protein
MDQPFKYQWLFDELSVSECPGDGCVNIERTAFRFCHEPIDHPWNFLPNILYDRARNRVRPVRALEPIDLCSLCNLSFYTTELAAKTKLTSFRTNAEKKHQHIADMYTHIAETQIKIEDGVASSIKREHFGFYEYEGVDFKTRKCKVISLE